MALPGVRTVLQDRFFTLSRTDVPEGTRVVGLARRHVDFEPYVISEEVDTYDDLPVLTTTEDGEFYMAGGSVYEWVWGGGPGEWVGPYRQRAANNKPFTPRSEQSVIDNFGQGSELHRCYLELLQGGANIVYLLPIESTKTDTDLEDTVFLDDVFDNAEVIRPDIIVLWGRGGHKTAATPTGFHSGMTGLVQYIATKCRDITDRSNPCFAVLGVEPADGDEGLAGSEVSAHIAFPTVPDRETIQHGQYVSIVATEVRPIAYPEGWGWANGAATYAALTSTVPSETGVTGKRLFDVDELRYSLTRPQQIELINKGIVPISYDSIGRPRVIDATTFATPPSDYVRLSTLRIIFDTTQMVRIATEPFVGQPATLHHRNSMETAISGALRNMQLVGALISSDFIVTYLPRENKAQVDLVITPAFEMRNIEVSISIQV